MKRSRRTETRHDSKGDEHGTLRLALPAASHNCLKRLRRGNPGECTTGAKDTSHLLVSERLPLEKGGTFKWEFYHPVLLVQHVVDNCETLSKIHSEKLEDCPSPWTIQLGVASTRLEAS